MGLLSKLVRSGIDAFEEAGDLIHDLGTPGNSGPAPTLDDMVDTVLDSATRYRRRFSDRAAGVLGDVDVEFQKFVRMRFDPLFGRARTEQLGEISTNEAEETIGEHEKSLNRKIAFTGLALVAIVGGVLYLPVTLIVSVPAAFTLTLPIYRIAYRSLRDEGKVNYHVLSAVNATGIWLGGFYIPATLATLFYYLGEKLLMITQDRSHKGLVNIFARQPKTVWVVRAGAESEIALDAVQRDDIVVVNAGQVVPVDGTLVEGLASVDQHALTGEAQPVELAIGDPVYASTLMLTGKALVRVERAGTETVAAQIGAILNRTASYQATLQSKGAALAHASALPTLVVGAFAWATKGLESGLAILNSALGVNIRITAPIAMLNFLNIASRDAILVKDGRSLELLHDVDTVVFDKTGTLTLEMPALVDIHTFDAFGAEDVLRYAAAAEMRQSHPIAKAILDAASARGLSLPEIDEAAYEVGYGIKVTIGDHRVRVGSSRFLKIEGLTVSETIEALQRNCHRRGHSTVLVGIDDRLSGVLELQPKLRSEAVDVVQELRNRGLLLVIISGDQEEPTRRLAQELRIDRYYANTLPENKAELVAKLQREGRAVCFVGDGINDSIALKKSNVSVSLRGATTVATDTAQIVLMDETLGRLKQVFELSDEFDATMRVGFATAVVPGIVNIAGVFLADWGLLKAIAIYNIGLLTSLGVAMWPLVSRRATQENRAGAIDG